MYTVYLAGGIASGKSTVARLLEQLGARRIDMDDLSREVCSAGSEVLRSIAHAFGDDVLDPQTGELRRATLARRAFVSEEDTRLLESITHPAIYEALEWHLNDPTDAPVNVVEVPLLDRALAHAHLCDEIACVVCPRDVRRVRAIGRGMKAEDFDRRDARQPSQEFIERHADTLFYNDNGPQKLHEQVHAWWSRVRRDM